MGNNDSKQNIISHRASDDSFLNSKSTNINNQEQKLIKPIFQRKRSDSNILNKNEAQKYFEKLSANENKIKEKKIDDTTIINKKEILNQNKNESGIMNNTLFNNVLFDDNNSEITKSKSTSDLSQNDSTSQQSNQSNQSNENNSIEGNSPNSFNIPYLHKQISPIFNSFSTHSYIDLDMKNVFFQRNGKKISTNVLHNNLTLLSNKEKELYSNDNNNGVSEGNKNSENQMVKSLNNNNTEISSQNNSQNQNNENLISNIPNSNSQYNTKDINNKNNKINSNNTIYQNDYELNFYRNGDEIRSSYMTKLICKKIWTPSIKDKTHNSLIIFDWDDTLLCTTFLTKNGIYDENIKLTEKDKEKIAKLEFSVLRLLTLSIEKCDVFIITNAGQGWVEYSCEKYYPSVFKLLKKINIISARGEYEKLYPNDSRMWKIQSFLNMQRFFNSNLVTNIICLGDSFIEIDAGHILASKFTQAFIKTVKFRESPKPEELNKQLTLVADQFDSIYKSIKNLTIRVEKKKK